ASASAFVHPSFFGHGSFAIRHLPPRDLRNTAPVPAATSPAQNEANQTHRARLKTASALSNRGFSHLHADSFLTKQTQTLHLKFQVFKSSRFHPRNTPLLSLNLPPAIL